MLTLLSFIGVILIVVFVHEYGHYVAARCFGVRVLHFSVGFGPALAKHRDRRGTEWALAPIPLGGYVRLLDKNAPEAGDYPQAESVDARPPWQRIVIYAAGPLANIILSLAIIVALLAGGERGLPLLIETIRPGSPAAEAGLPASAEIRAINGAPIILARHAEVAIVDSIIAGDDIVIDAAGGARYTIPAGRLGLTGLGGGAANAAGIIADESYVLLTVATVVPGSAAEKGGLQTGDSLVAMDGVVLDSWREAVAIISRFADKPLEVIVWRDNAALTLQVTPAKKETRSGSAGYLGVAPQIDRALLAQRMVTLSYSPPGLAAAAARQIGADVHRAAAFVRLVIAGGAESEHVSGPVGIAAQSGQAAELGFAAWLRFVSLISTSLGVLNLLPLPLLDGGQIVLNVLQWMRRREFSDKTLLRWQAAGGVILLMIMTFVIINDIIQLL